MTPKLTKEQAVGVLVNIMHESDFNYTATEHSDGSGGYALYSGQAEEGLTLSHGAITMA